MNVVVDAVNWSPLPQENVRAIRFAIELTKRDSMMIRRTSFRPGYVDWGRLLLLAGTSLLPACGDSFDDHPPVYPVKGKVNFQGKPMSGGTILFEYEGEGGADAPAGPPGKPFRVTGKIDSKGTFNLVAYPGSEGVPAGKYKVGILAAQGRSENIFNPKAIMPTKAGAAILSKEYADPKKSGLSAEVSKDKPNEPVFDLK